MLQLGVGGYGFYGDFWSTPNSVGMIMATGNVGDYLLLQPGDVNTYMSTDAGFLRSSENLSDTKASTGTKLQLDPLFMNTEIMEESSLWSTTKQLSNFYVPIHPKVLTNTLYYSFDQGSTWTAFNFTDSPVVVVNVYASSYAFSRFVIFSVRGNQVVYFGVDFENVLPRVCTDGIFMYMGCLILPQLTLNNGNTQLPMESLASQEEKLLISMLPFTPAYLFNLCRRRKPNVVCDHPENYDPVLSVRNCNCTVDDYGKSHDTS